MTRPEFEKTDAGESAALQKTKDRKWNSPTAKAIQIAILLLVTLIGNELIGGLVDEREYRQSGFSRELTENWGPEQVVHTPILIVPYYVKEARQQQYLKIAPAVISSNVKLTPEQKRRGLFSATIYTGMIAMEGRFAIPSQERLQEFVDRGNVLRWEDAFVALEVTELSGVRAEDTFHWGEANLAWRNCAEAGSYVSSCRNGVLIARPKLTSQPEPGSEIPFTASLTLRGTSAFNQILEGQNIKAAISAPWPTPSFNGQMLPISSEVTDDGFEGRWQSFEYSHQQIWVSSSIAGNASSPNGPRIGVALLEATPIYRMINRVSKYAILFVVLAFTAYFLFELLSGIRIHIIQYGLLGVSLTLFGLLLLSFAEPLGYTFGYALSAGLVLTQASVYTLAITKKIGPSLLFAALLASLFGFLYVLLSLESYSLLVGSVALFIVLTVVMILTQKVNWSGGEIR